MKIKVKIPEQTIEQDLSLEEICSYWYSPFLNDEVYLFLSKGEQKEIIENAIKEYVVRTVNYTFEYEN